MVMIMFRQCARTYLSSILIACSLGSGAAVATKVPIFVLGSPSETWELGRFPVLAYCLHGGDLLQVAELSAKDDGSDGLLLDGSIGQGLLLVMGEESVNIRVIELASVSIYGEVAVELPAGIGLRTIFPTYSQPLRIVVQHSLRDAEAGSYQWPIKAYALEKRQWLESGDELVATTLISGSGPWHRQRNASYQQGRAEVAIDSHASVSVGILPPGEFMGGDELLTVLYRNERFAVIMSLSGIYKESAIPVAIWDAEQGSWSYLTLPEPVDQVTASGSLLFFEFLRKGSIGKGVECVEDARYRNYCDRNSGSGFVASRNKLIYEPSTGKSTELAFEDEDSRLLGVIGDQVVARQGRRIVRFALDDFSGNQVVADNDAVGGIHWMFMADQGRVAEGCEALP